MRLFMCILLVVAVSASAGVKTDGTGIPSSSWSYDGTYEVVNVMAGDLAGTYGMAIKDNVANSIWILDYSTLTNTEFDMAGGSPTGTTWSIGGGVDPDDQAYCEYTSGNQWFMGDYTGSWFAVYEEDGTWLYNIDGPAAGWTKIMAIGAGHDMVYVGANAELAWGAYLGAEAAITWTVISYESIYGLAVWEDYLFVATGIEDSDNIFIHEIAADGTPSASPVWSCQFIENVNVNGGIDYDGTYLWVYPQQDFLYQLDIDFIPGALEADTWAGVKSSF